MIRFEPDETAGGLAAWTIANKTGHAKVTAHGAHLLQWQPRDQRSVLWLSAHSEFAPGKAIRGGVPLCFPWFGPNSNDANAPMHGLARTHDWELMTSRNHDENSGLILVPSAEIMALNGWPRDCEIFVRFSLSANLEIEFSVRNNGTSTCEYEIALHAYFAVGDVRECEVSGLESVPFWDKVAQQMHDGEAEPIRITAETDRVYQNTASTCILRDNLWNREIAVHKIGSQTTVVWNPWIDKAAKMADFGDDEWTQMLCIETANAGENRVRLAPSAQHSTIARIEVRDL